VAEIKAEVTGTIWKIQCAVGDTVGKGATVMILESMKMEIPVESAHEGRVKEIRCAEGQPVQEGEVLAIVE
jgi:acetyl-CoA carboxylase biotin carboxyl carrier protein